MRINKIFFLSIIIASLFVPNLPVFSQDDTPDTASPAPPAPEFGLGLLLGVETFDPAVPGEDPETYQTIALQPDFAIGDFGIGLDLVLHYRFISDSDTGFDIREEDWVPVSGQSVIDLYLPKITYLRWAHKGDPLYVKLGQIDDTSLGTGFIVNNYSNTIFQPDEKIVGLNFDLDGQFFDFPYLGIETFIGNFAQFDVLGGRLYSRPILWSGIPIVKDLEWGITVAADTNPDLRPEFYDTDINNGAAANAVVIYGTDVILPIFNFDIASLALFGDVTVEGKNTGGMVGFGGRFIGIIPYLFQLRILGDNFIPAYFDTTYDLYRGIKYDILNYSGTLIPGSVSWLASTGFSVLGDRLALTATLDGPFALPPTGSIDDHTYLEYPHLNAQFLVNEGLIPNFSFSAEYDKKYINDIADLLSGENSMINLAINYAAGAAVITLSYDMVYMTDDVAGLSWDDFDVSSSLSCSIELF